MTTPEPPEAVDVQMQEKLDNDEDRHYASPPPEGTVVSEGLERSARWLREEAENVLLLRRTNPGYGSSPSMLNEVASQVESLLARLQTAEDRAQRYEDEMHYLSDAGWKSVGDLLEAYRKLLIERASRTEETPSGGADE